MKLSPVPGVLVGSAACGLKDKGDDVALFSFAKPCPTAVVFTTNLFCGVPVDLARKHLGASRGRSSGWVVNSGNANCGTGKRGHRAAVSSCANAARLLACEPQHILPFSTGVIGEPLAATKLNNGIRRAKARLGPDRWSAAAEAIMTTDTRPKGASLRVKTSGGMATLTGIAKGSGMIHPNMATMLGFICTDCKLTSEQMKNMLAKACKGSFNAISVDGDTSTNDAVAFAATGALGPPGARGLRRLEDALTELCGSLSAQIVADGEGATSQTTVKVSGFGSSKACRKIADAVANSLLVKTMLHGRSPNIGRVFAAAGGAGVEFNPNSVTIKVNGRLIFVKGALYANYDEKRVVASLKAKTRNLIEISDSRRKISRAQVTFCDLSSDYVSINADYVT